ncbi:AbrB/MazE/SpoVT family DNA-binding domain-containing protein [Streptomyces sp. NBC_01537]|uniref:AbrB/MazE/SpoVT family DNA-binding domain-containing protein n=1 Tax=Streptomyces sp. NBC_01537 TaxID=2903896 RepID=UPI003870CCA4
MVTHDLAVASRDGRTASEVVRRTTIDEHGRESVTASEYATVDRAGRLELPRDFTEALDICDRVLLELEPDHITLRPDESNNRTDAAG